LTKARYFRHQAEGRSTHKHNTAFSSLGDVWKLGKYPKQKGAEYLRGRAVNPGGVVIERQHLPRLEEACSRFESALTLGVTNEIVSSLVEF